MTVRWLAPFVLLAALLGQGLHTAWNTGQTVDETFYTGSAYPIVRYNFYDILTEHPPLTMQLGALPLLFLQPKYPLDHPLYIGNSNEIDSAAMGARFLYESGNNPQAILFLERLPVIAIMVLAGWILFRWSSELFGWWGGMLSLVLFSFSPNIIGYGSLFMSDMVLTACFFLAIYRLRLFFLDPTVRNGVLTGVWCGLALMTKMSALLLIPITLMLFVLFPLLKPKCVVQTGKTTGLNWWLAFLCVLFYVLSISEKLVFLAIAPLCVSGLWLITPPTSEHGQIPYKIQLSCQIAMAVLSIFSVVLWTIFLILSAAKRHPLIITVAAVWLFTIFSLSVVLKANPKAQRFQHLGKVFILIWLVAMVAIFFGYTDFADAFSRFNSFHRIVRSFNISSTHSLEGHTGYIDGSFVFPDWRYFILTMLVKTPVATLLLLLIGLFVLPALKIARLEIASVLIPPVVYLLFASLVNKIFIGVRHVLPVYPFLFLVAGATIPALMNLRFPSMRIAFRILLGGLMASYVGLNLLSAPHQLSFFSEWVGGTEQGAKLVHVNMGQDNKRLAEVIREQSIPHIKIGSMSNNPAEYKYYGIEWSYMTESDFVHPTPGYYAIDLTAYLSQQRKPDSWFYKRMPTYRAGKVMYVFHVT